LMNDGKGRFENVTPLFAFGMIRDAVWVNMDDDEDEDLVVVGEWMSPLVFENAKGRLTNPKKLIDKNGWWLSVESADINNDGRKDLVLGNYGRNSKLEPGIPGKEKEHGPLKLFIMDPDKNKSPDQVMAIKKDGNYYPFLAKEDLERQLPFLKKKFLSYAEMAGQDMAGIFGEELNSATILEAETFTSIVLLSEGKKGFKMQALPFYQQLSPVFTTIVDDFNKDNKLDILVAGNFSGVMPYEGKYDALLPSLGFQQNDGQFKCQMPIERSLRINGEIRSMKKIRVNNMNAIIIARNNDAAVLVQATSF
jgi:enediyne biosynthesis protein E4